jgi:polyphosphate kinase 2 (PPK2 family)
MPDPPKNKKPRRPADTSAKLPREVYERELYRLQSELVKMQGWMRSTGARMVVIFEGRDARAARPWRRHLTRPVIH